jgi:multimeric flavodoxin WrbA
MKNLKVVAFNGSPQRQGNTSIMIGRVFEELEKQGIETELMQIGGRPVRGCVNCEICVKKQNLRCVVDDWVNDAIEKMIRADGIIIGSPAYFGDLTPETKALMDRAGRVTRVGGKVHLARKVGAALSAARRAAAMTTIDSIQRFFTINEMVLVSSCYWNVAYGLEPGDVTSDEEGMMVMQRLGENMAWVLKKLNG